MEQPSKDFSSRKQNLRDTNKSAQQNQGRCEQTHIIPQSIDLSIILEPCGDLKYESK